jgi:hypothetical protein
MRPYLKNIQHKKGLVEWAQGVGPEFKPQYREKKLNTFFIVFKFPVLSRNINLI